MNALFDYDKNGTVGYKDIFNTIFSLMKDEKKNKKINGVDKKNNVLQKIEIIIGSSEFNLIRPYLEDSIEFIYEKLIKKHCFNKCFKCCKK